MKELSNDNGVARHFKKEDGRIYVSATQDVENALNHNAIDRNNDLGNWKGDLHKVASVPVVVIEQWNKELRDMGHPNPNVMARENHGFFMAKINDRMYGKLRTKEGMV